MTLPDLISRLEQAYAQDINERFQNEMRALLRRNDRECIEALNRAKSEWEQRACMEAYARLFEMKADMLMQRYGFSPREWPLPAALRAREAKGKEGGK